MTKKDILEYYLAWGHNQQTNEMAIKFTSMLLRKATFALGNNTKIFAGGDLRTGKQLESMYCRAEDMFCDNPELRGV